MKKTISVFFVILLLLTAAPLAGFFGMEIAPKAKAYSVGDHIQYGTYPQTQVFETPELQVAATAATWKSYDYYTGTGSSSDGKMTPSRYMKFADFFFDGTKYRAVKFTKYRPNSTGGQSNAFYSYQDDNGYEPNNTYYFKYEPLTWRILNPSTGYIMCESIVDSQAYQNTMYCVGDLNLNDFSYQAIDSSVYANDYATSSIRTWLNYDFYETAFTVSQKENVRVTALNNNSEAGYAINPEQYNSAATNDKIFLLSWADALNTSYGFSSSSSPYDTARRAQGTDYAKCQGLLVSTYSEYSGYSNWWLRSPYGSDAHSACTVIDGGWRNACVVSMTYLGVRPACRLTNLISDISQSNTQFSGGTHEHQAGEPVIENEVDATCKSKGSYEEVVYCTECGEKLSRTPHETQMLEHIPGAAATENEVAATCQAKGSYDEVVRCTECGSELSRTPHETQMLDHISSEPIKENEIKATCISTGSYDSVVYCSECKTELNREKCVIKKLEHIPGSETEEIIQAASCTREGEKKLTVFCTECGNVVSEKTEPIPALHHSYVTTITPATCTAIGYTTYTCERGDHSYVSDYSDMLQHKDSDNDGFCDYCKNQMTGGDHCKYCGKIHDGAFGWLVKFFHNILAIFKR